MQLRINIRKVRGLIWLASAGALVLAGWTFFVIFTQKQAKHYDPHSSQYFKTQVLNANVRGQSVSARKPFYAQADFEKLWMTLIDGTVRVVEQPPGPDDAPKLEVPKAPPIETIVDVGLIIWAPQPELRFAAITYKAGGGAPPTAAAAGAGTVPTKEKRLHLSEGDPLQPPYDVAPFNGKVVRIDEQEVTFQWGEGEAVITPKLGKDGTGKPDRVWSIPDEEDAMAGVDPNPADTTQIKPGHWIVGTQDRDRARDNMQTFMDQELNVRTITPSGGGSSWLELTDVKPNSLAAKFGAQKGDRIISVNGIPMPSKSAAINWYKQNTELPFYVIVYERNGKQDSLTIHSK